MGFIPRSHQDRWHWCHWCWCYWCHLRGHPAHHGYRGHCGYQCHDSAGHIPLTPAERGEPDDWKEQQLCVIAWLWRDSKICQDFTLLHGTYSFQLPVYKQSKCIPLFSVHFIVCVHKVSLQAKTTHLWVCVCVCLGVYCNTNTCTYCAISKCLCRCVSECCSTYTVSFLWDICKKNTRGEDQGCHQSSQKHICKYVQNILTNSYWPISESVALVWFLRESDILQFLHQIKLFLGGMCQVKTLKWLLIGSTGLWFIRIFIPLPEYVRVQWSPESVCSPPPLLHHSLVPMLCSWHLFSKPMTEQWTK